MKTANNHNGVKTELTPRFLRRIAVVFYDALLLLAVLAFATAVILPFNDGKAFTASQYVYPLYLLLVSFLFYGWFWTHGGQTLGLKTWKLQVLTFDRQPLHWQQAAMRFITAVLSWCLGGLGFIWVLYDKNGYALHDYLSKTAIFFTSADR